MARWIDASPSQRFWQYELPAAKRLVESGEWDACLAESDRKVADAEARLAASDPDGIEHRRWTRRLAACVRERETCVQERDRDLAIIAEAERRRAARPRRASRAA